jgi:dTDP-4-amino-4,6-dideoxygalactose transaminase
VDDATLPLVDLRRQYASLEREISDAVLRVCASGAFVGGEEVAHFEEEFAEFVTVKFCVGVANGTDALHLALRANGIGAGDEVIVPVNSFIATGEAVTMAGATPVFVDVDPATLQLDPQAAANACSPRTACIVPVHLFGHPCDIGEVIGLAERRGLLVIEDAAQAHGASWRRQRVGSFGAASAFSFYPGKNLGAAGDGGAVVTNDADVAARVRRLANHGRGATEYVHEVEGFNSRLDALQAAVLRVKLRRLDKWNGRRREIAAGYTQSLAGTEIRPVTESTEGLSVYHLYVVRCQDRASLRKGLASVGVATGVHYPVPLHLQPAYARFGHTRGEFPCAELAADQIVSLPIFPEMTKADIDRVTSYLREIA